MILPVPYEECHQLFRLPNENNLRSERRTDRPDLPKPPIHSMTYPIYESISVPREPLQSTQSEKFA